MAVTDEKRFELSTFHKMERIDDSTVTTLQVLRASPPDMKFGLCCLFNTSGVWLICSSHLQLQLLIYTQSSLRAVSHLPVPNTICSLTIMSSLQSKSARPNFEHRICQIRVGCFDQLNYLAAFLR